MHPILKNIIFDLGGVLLDLDMERCFNAFEQAGLTDVRRWLTGTNELGFFSDYECGRISTEAFRRQLRSRLAATVTDEETDRIWNSMLVSIPQEKQALLEELTRHYRLFLLSNTNELHWQHCTEHVFRANGKDVLSCFDQTFLSFRMGMAKPDVEIFSTVVREAGLEASETLFIDDAPANCTAAGQAGLHALHYRPGTGLRQLLNTVLP